MNTAQQRYGLAIAAAQAAYQSASRASRIARAAIEDIRDMQAYAPTASRPVLQDMRVQVDSQLSRCIAAGTSAYESLHGVARLVHEGNRAAGLE